MSFTNSLPKVFVDGIEYAYSTYAEPIGGLKQLDVYNVASQEHVVGVFFDDDLETAVVEGPEFQESAPYFELKEMTFDDIASWAVQQIPGY